MKRLLGVPAALLAAVLALSGCGEPGRSGGSDTVTVRGNLVGQVAGTSTSAGKSAGKQAAGASAKSAAKASGPGSGTGLTNLSGNVAVLLIEKSGRQSSTQIVTRENGRFNLTAEKGKEFVIVVREGKGDGQTLGILITDNAKQQVLFAVNDDQAEDIDLGNIALDRKKGKAVSLEGLFLDGPPDFLADADGDGLPDIIDDKEDQDGDGVADASDDFPFDVSEVVDTDGDGVGDNEDLDNDNDGIPDVNDPQPNQPQSGSGGGSGSNSGPGPNAGPGNAINPDDLDDDGVPNGLDAFPNDKNEQKDTDGDGVGDKADKDDDNDGVNDGQDAFPLNAAETADNDGDGIGDNADPDDDNDGIPDTQDAFPLDPAENADNDNDGMGNNNDPDDDNDGVEDDEDDFPFNPNEQEDNDDDGIGDNADIDDDNDGVADAEDAFPMDPAEQADNDMDGIGDNADLDDDNDGIPDAQDVFPTEAVKSLKATPVPEPVNLGVFLNSAPGVNAAGFPNVDPDAKAAAIQLGKALFWDMNVGSDVQACASCHFHAGSDSRFVNNVSPGLNAGDTTFQVGGPNQPVTAANFPFFQTNPVDDDEHVVTNDINDVISSQGVFLTSFIDIVIGDPFDLGTPVVDAVFNVAGTNTRRVEPRNAPTVINAVFNYSNFHDGRARNIFNGANPFGELDQTSGIFVQNGGVINPAKQIVRIPDASLASQAVGPPLSSFEMSFDGRTFAKLGKKILAASLQPLSRQEVAGDDSVLGPLADAPTGLIEITPGENAYASLIKQAFKARYWDAPNQHITFAGNVHTINGGAANSNDTSQFTQMEANFALFFGLVVQLYEATLVSDDSKFDQVVDGLAAFTEEEADGFGTFTGAGSCAGCHAVPETTNHSVSLLRGGELPTAPDFLPSSPEFVEIVNFGSSQSFADIGFTNISVRRTTDDGLRGGNSPFVNPINAEPLPLSFARLGILKRDGLLPADVALFVPDLGSNAPLDAAGVDGAPKVSNLRNAELTGPYMSNGGQSTLAQVVEFYTRGGNVPVDNAANHNDLVDRIGRLRNAPDKRANLVRFLMTLTDERVRLQQAPFDHPQLFVPAGDGLQNPAGNPPSPAETFIEIPAVGAAGSVTPLGTFLNLDPVTGQ